MRIVNPTAEQSPDACFEAKMHQIAALPRSVAGFHAGA